MDRRDFLAICTGGIPGLTGCSSQSEPTSTPRPSFETPVEPSTDPSSSGAIEMEVSIEDTHLIVGDVLEVHLTLKNSGDSTRTIELALELDGRLAVRELISVSANDTESVVLTTTVM